MWFGMGFGHAGVSLVRVLADTGPKVDRGANQVNLNKFFIIANDLFTPGPRPQSAAATPVMACCPRTAEAPSGAETTWIGTVRPSY